MTTWRLTTIVCTAALAVACSDAAAPGSDGTLTLRFGIDDGAISARSAGLFLSRAGGAGAAALELTGSNGTLTLDEVWLVADEFKLELVDGTCDEIGGEDDAECFNFELDPFFASVPADGDAAGQVTVEVAPGSYDALKFETRAAAGGALLDAIRAQFDDWPTDASLLVVGSFTPTGGTAVPFRVYFDAEVKVELAFEEPLVMETEGQFVTVLVDPAIWFANSNGTVDDLSLLDFDETGEVVTFEALFAEGFTKIELGDE